MIREDRDHEAGGESRVLIQFVERRHPDLDTERLADLTRVDRAHLTRGIEHENAQRLLRLGEAGDRGEDVFLAEAGRERFFNRRPKLRCHGGLKGGAARAGLDEDAGARAHDHMARGPEVPVGGGDRVRVDFELARPDPDWRKAGAAGQFAREHGEFDLSANLVFHGNARVPPDPHLHSMISDRRGTFASGFRGARGARRRGRPPASQGLQAP